MPSYPDPRPIGTTRPSPARVYDALLGGKDNFAADREAAQRLVDRAPETTTGLRANRAFLTRAVRFVAEQDVHQFIDLGSGLPTSPNVHEVARQVHWDTAVVYVDNDPVVAAHGRALNAIGPAKVVQADLNDPDEIIRECPLIDFARPVGLLAAAVLHFLDDASVVSLLGAFRPLLASGSYLVISHGSPGTRDDADYVLEDYNQTVTTLWPRSLQQITDMFNGYELVEPGVVPVQRWRSVAAVGDSAVAKWEMLAGVARVP